MSSRREVGLGLTLKVFLYLRRLSLWSAWYSRLSRLREWNLTMRCRGRPSDLPEFFFTPQSHWKDKTYNNRSLRTTHHSWTEYANNKLSLVSESDIDNTFWTYNSQLLSLLIKSLQIFADKAIIISVRQNYAGQAPTQQFERNFNRIKFPTELPPNIFSV